jgi:hypothetical protein
MVPKTKIKNVLKGKKFTLYFCRGKVQRGRKTKVWGLRKDSDKAMGEYLGSIDWRGSWRQYVFRPAECTDWSKGCLLFVASFLEQVNKEHRNK